MPRSWSITKRACGHASDRWARDTVDGRSRQTVRTSARPASGEWRSGRSLGAVGWRYDSGFEGPTTSGRIVSECYPYTTLVGAEEFGFDVERPRYKRSPKGMKAAEFRPLRSAACDVVIQRLGGLVHTDPPLVLESHPLGSSLLSEPSPCLDREYKHREDLIDAILCAWTGLLWTRFGFSDARYSVSRWQVTRPLRRSLHQHGPSNVG